MFESSEAINWFQASPGPVQAQQPSSPAAQQPSRPAAQPPSSPAWRQWVCKKKRMIYRPVELDTWLLCPIYFLYFTENQCFFYCFFFVDLNSTFNCITVKTDGSRSYVEPTLVCLCVFYTITWPLTPSHLFSLCLCLGFILKNT